MRNLRVIPAPADPEGPKGFGYRLNTLRVAQGLKDAELAARIRCSPESVHHWETGATSPGFWALLEIAQFFNVSLDWLCGMQQPRQQEGEAA